MGLTPNFDPAANCQLYSRNNRKRKREGKRERETIVAQRCKLQNVWMSLDYITHYQIKTHY